MATLRAFTVHQTHRMRASHYLGQKPSATMPSPDIHQSLRAPQKLHLKCRAAQGWSQRQAAPLQLLCGRPSQRGGGPIGHQ